MLGTNGQKREATSILIKSFRIKMRPRPIENIHIVTSDHCWQRRDRYATLFPSLRLFSTHSLLFLVKRYKSTLAPPKLSVSVSLSEEVPPSYKAALRIYNSCQRTLASQCSTMLHNAPQFSTNNAPQCSTMHHNAPQWCSAQTVLGQKLKETTWHQASS